MKGRVHSIQSLGTLDGPGIRFVAFLQGCPLRCGCCHNPDTWDVHGGREYEAQELVQKALRYREYFGEEGGITLSGGEPLLQPMFAAEVFRLAKAAGVNTCLDTSGCLLNEEIGQLLEVADRVLLDVKYPTDDLYRRYVGCGMEPVLQFLKALDERGIPVTLRQVIIPTLNDDVESLRALRRIAQAHACVDKVELLPFRKICQVKYDQMGIDFPFAHLPEPGAETMRKLEEQLKA